MDLAGSEMTAACCKCQRVFLRMVSIVHWSDAKVPQQLFSFFDKESFSCVALRERSIILAYSDAISVEENEENTWIATCERCLSRFYFFKHHENFFAVIPNHWIKPKKRPEPYSHVSLPSESPIPNQMKHLFVVNSMALSPVMLPLPAHAAYGQTPPLEMPTEYASEQDDDMMFSSTGNCLVGSFVENPLMGMMDYM